MVLGRGEKGLNPEFQSAKTMHYNVRALMNGESFYERTLMGDLASQILVKNMIQDSGYVVCQYGYENVFPMFTSVLRNQYSPTSIQIRSSPDFLIHDPYNRDVKLAEVKSSSAEIIRIPNIETYQTYWGNALCILVMNCGNVFYAEEFCNLKFKKFYDPEQDFKPIQVFFPYLNEEHFADWQNKAVGLIKELKTTDRT